MNDGACCEKCGSSDCLLMVDEQVLCAVCRGESKRKYERMLDDLEPEEVAILRGVTKENLVVEVVADWVDDHERCVGVKLNGVEVSFWWLTFEAAAAFCYPDSDKAKDVIVEVVKDQLQNF